MEISVDLTLSPLQDDYETHVIKFIKRLRDSEFTVLENPLSTQIFGEYDTLMSFLTREIKQIFDFLFGQYAEYQTVDIVLEIIAVVFGFLSVWFSKQNKIWVFPTGMISTVLFVYLLFKWELLGDMMHM